MENQELNVEQQNNANLLTVNVKNYLMETARWGKFLAILGYVGLGFLLILSLLMIFGMSFLSNSLSGMSQLYQTGSLSLVSVGMMYILIIAIYFFPIYFLHIFSLRIKSGLLTNNASDMELGFKNLKSLFKFMGIVSIVVLSIYVLALIIIVPVAIFLN
jgi:hypothetical protein